MTRVLGKQNNAAWASVYKRLDGGVSLSVGVQDSNIRNQGIPHDGMEKAFALVPQSNGEWKRYDLEYTGTSFSRGSVAGGTDHFALVLDGWDGNVKIEDLQQQGVAFGLEVKPSDKEPSETLWLQGWGDNYKIR